MGSCISVDRSREAFGMSMPTNISKHRVARQAARKRRREIIKNPFAWRDEIVPGTAEVPMSWSFILVTTQAACSRHGSHRPCASAYCPLTVTERRYARFLCHQRAAKCTVQYHATPKPCCRRSLEEQPQTVGGVGEGCWWWEWCVVCGVWCVGRVSGGGGGWWCTDVMYAHVSVDMRQRDATWVAEHLGASSRRPRHPFPALMAGEPLAVYLCTRP